MKISKISGILGAVCLAMTAQLAIAEYENTPYYEEEPWYDVTEWFDGDDYRRTDVATSDNEYDYNYEYDYGYHVDPDGDVDYGGHYDLESSDSTNAYGYDDQYADDNWFYDYWNDGYAYYEDDNRDGVFEYSVSYYDYDNDGYYDAYTSLYDWDNDGFYEDAEYYSFNDAATSSNASSTQESQESQSKSRRVSGQIANVKKTSVRDTKHLIVKLKSEDREQPVIDLGPVDALSNFDIQSGDKLNANGPVIQVGEKKLLVAQSAKVNGESISPERQGRSISGTIADVRTVKNRGKNFVLASVKTEADKKVLVDLGMKDQLEAELKKDTQITVEGAPVTLKDKRVLVAQELRMDDKSYTISRNKQQPSQVRSSQSASNGEQQRTRSFSGEVAETKKVDVRGSKRHLVMLDTSSGKTMCVDCGPANDKKVDCEKGDQIKVRGVVVRNADGKPIVLATKISANDKTKTVRSEPRQNLKEVSGDVQSVQTVKVRGKQRQLATLATNDGNNVVVDLGPPNALSMDLSEGQQLSAKGRMVKANDQIILVAFQAGTEDGKSESIKRASTKSGNSNRK